MPWITGQYHRGAELASLCVGAFLLAETGLLGSTSKTILPKNSPWANWRITISSCSNTPTLQAIELMRRHRVGSLPVVEEGNRLVGIITERDLIRVAAMLFEKHLREATAE